MFILLTGQVGVYAEDDTELNVLSQKFVEIRPPIHPVSLRCALSVGPLTRIDRAPSETGVSTPEFANVFL